MRNGISHLAARTSKSRPPYFIHSLFLADPTHLNHAFTNNVDMRAEMYAERLLRLAHVCLGIPVGSTFGTPATKITGLRL